jgi:nucleoside-diphosphate-sugar epimerase
MKNKILITGGSGFLGSNLINKLIKLKYEILNIDINEPRIKNHVKYWMYADIRNFKKLSEEFNAFQPEYIIHLAARTDLNGHDISDYDTNVQGTKNIVDICNKNKSIKRALFASSMLVNSGGSKYVDLKVYNPDTVYGDSKVKMEQIITNSENKIPWIIIRPTSIWGPWFGEPYNNFFNFVINKMFFHPGSKACTKTYGYIDNSVFQMLKLLLTAEASLVQHKIFYIGDSPAIDISDWADEISIQNCGKKNIKVNFLFFEFAALIGDLLSLVNIKFPMTSFRLKNMTTDNIVPLEELYKVVGNVPFTRLEGTVKTLEWIRGSKKGN